jgi:hypothetical protein
MDTDLAWEQGSVVVKRARLLLDGDGLPSECDLDAGLVVVLDALRSQGWEICPDHSVTDDRVRIRRRVASKGDPARSVDPISVIA